MVVATTSELVQGETAPAAIGAIVVVGWVYFNSGWGLGSGIPSCLPLLEAVEAVDGGGACGVVQNQQATAPRAVGVECAASRAAGSALPAPSAIASAPFGRGLSRLLIARDLVRSSLLTLIRHAELIVRVILHCLLRRRD